MGEFSNRLNISASHADMTVSDLAKWFDRARPTVNTWVKGRTPMGPSGRKARWRLELLEWAIAASFKLPDGTRAFPIPDTCGGRDRPSYVRKIRDAIEQISDRSRVSNEHPTA